MEWFHYVNTDAMLFNFFRKSAAPRVNHEGGVAFTLNPEMELYTAVATSTLNDQFYEKGSDRLFRIRELVQNCDAQFVARLARYAREEMHLRSVPLVLAVELSKLHKGDSLVSRTVDAVVQRADEITELLAYYQLANKRRGTKKLNKLSKQVQKGLARAFNRFDEYQFSKYNRNAEVKLRDALFLVHPKAKNEGQQALFDRIAKNELATAFTWETELSAVGQKTFADNAARKAAFCARWEALIDSGKLGYMALLRNLRNILEAGVSPGHIEKVCAVLADEKAVARSKQLPFRFVSAWRELKAMNSFEVPLILDALEVALTHSTQNLRGFSDDSRILIACDVSGSMYAPISPRSTVENFDIGLVLAMLLQSRCKLVETGIFGDTYSRVALSSRNVLSNVEQCRSMEGKVGYSTNGYRVIDDLISRNLVVDRIMMFTDCQLYDSKNGGASLSASWKRYKEIAPAARLCLFDLAGHGTSPVDLTADGVSLIAGWSDKVFDLLHALENNEDALKMIHRIEI